MSGRPGAVQTGRQACRHVIIGHGPAGLSAAEAIRALDADASITIVSEEPYRFYSRPGLAFYLAKRVPQEQLFSRPDAYYRHWRIDTVHARAEGLDPTARLVHLAGGRLLPYDRLLLATGSAAALPNVPGIDLAGVVTLDSLSDTRTILDAVRQARSAVVVGGGVTALELIVFFWRAASRSITCCAARAIGRRCWTKPNRGWFSSACVTSRSRSTPKPSSARCWGARGAWPA